MAGDPGEERILKPYLLLPALALVLTTLFVAACGRPADRSAGRIPELLRVGLVPNQSPEEVKAQYEPFREYLSERLAMPVELFVATDYAGVVEAMASDRLDLAYFGALTYVQAEQRADVRPIVTEVDSSTGSTRYHSAIITREDSDIRKVGDIGGGRFAFGDVSSTSGSLYPRKILADAGITDFNDPEQFVYTGGHDATALAVQNGTVAAGGVEERILQRLVENGTVDGDRIRVVERALVPGYPWVVRSVLPDELVGRVTDAFLEMDDPELLKLMRAERYERVDAAYYDEVRELARRFGLVAPEPEGR